MRLTEAPAATAELSTAAERQLDRASTATERQPDRASTTTERQPDQNSPAGPSEPPARLTLDALPALERLYRQLADGPDAFQPQQLEHGIYFGIRRGDQLLSAAGTHVACRPLGIAALGNVATLPTERGRGLGAAVCRAVIDELRGIGYRTIVLNVRMENQAAIRVYRKLGFMPYCGFYEGRGFIH